MQCPGWTPPVSNNVPSGGRGELWPGPLVHAQLTLVCVLGECSEKGITSFSGPGRGLLLWASPTVDFYEQHCLPWDKCEKVFFQRRGWTMRRNHVFHNLYLERIIALEALTMIRRPLGSSSTLSWCSRCFFLARRITETRCMSRPSNQLRHSLWVPFSQSSRTQSRRHDPWCRMFGVAEEVALCHFRRRVCLCVCQIASAVSQRRTLSLIMLKQRLCHSLFCLSLT